MTFEAREEQGLFLAVQPRLHGFDVPVVLGLHNEEPVRRQRQVVDLRQPAATVTQYQRRALGCSDYPTPERPRGLRANSP